LLDLDIIYQLLITYSALFRYLRRKWEYISAVHQLFIDFKKTYDSDKREELYNTVTEFDILKFVMVIKICLKTSIAKFV